MSDARMASLYGSARLETEGPDSMSELFRPEGSDCVVMGVNRTDHGQHGVLWNPAKDKGHAFTFGTTQTGKGVGSLIPALLSYGNAYAPGAGGGILCIDPKGENCFTTYHRRVAMGQKVVVLDPWNEVNERFGHGQQVVTVSTYNPIAGLDPKHPDFADELARLSDALVVTPPSVSDPHWSDSARELIGGMIAAVVELSPEGASLDDVRSLLMGSDAELVDFVRMICASRPDSLAARKLARFTSGTDEIQSIRSTAVTQTAILDSARLMASMSSSAGFDLAELADGATVFVVLPMDRLVTHGRWLRLVLSQAIDAVAKRRTPPRKPVLFLVDEMGTIGKLEKLETAVGLLSSYGIRVWGFLQNLTQLQTDYPSNWRTFLANASYLQLTQAGDDATADWFSKRLGNTTIRNVEISQNAGESQGIGTGSTSSGFSTQIGYHNRPLMLPSDIYELGKETAGDEVLVIGPRGHYFRLLKFVYYIEPGYRGWFALNPRHPAPVFKPTAAELQAAWEAGEPERIRALAVAQAAQAEADAKARRAARWRRLWIELWRRKGAFAVTLAVVLFVLASFVSPRYPVRWAVPIGIPLALWVRDRLCFITDDRLLHAFYLSERGWWMAFIAVLAAPVVVVTMNTEFNEFLVLGLVMLMVAKPSWSKMGYLRSAWARGAGGGMVETIIGNTRLGTRPRQTPTGAVSFG